MTKFDLYFSTIVGWQLHPGYLRDNANPMPIEECAEWALKMVEIAEEVEDEYYEPEDE